MADKRKVQIEAEVTADTSGLEQIADAAKDMAQAVQQAGQQASQGLNAVSQSAAPAAQSLDAAQKRMQASIERTTATLKAGQAGTADYFEALARARNIDTAPFDAYIGELRRVEAAQKAAKQATADNAKADAFVASLRAQADAVGRTRAELLALQAAELGIADKVAPYIQRLREADQGQTQLGMSAKATAAAMRGVPAQFTDIITALQGGQRPITVLLQQGGQLKDMFGGIGPAARALGGYVLSLVNPFTVAAAVAGTLAFALSQGREELRAFQNAATLSGNAVGLSASGFTQMRDALAGIAGTRGKAAEVLTEIARNGQLAGGSVKAIGEAAILMEQATGQAIGKTVGQFADLAKSPTEAAAKLNEQYHFLTTAVFSQIKALEDQGKAVDAARLAEDTYTAALKGRAEIVIGNAGLMERAWKSVADGAKLAWDKMLGIGRDLSPADQVAAAAAKVAQLQAQLAAPADPGRGASVGMSVPGLGAAAAGGGRQATERSLALAKEELATAQRRLEIENRNTQAAAEQNRLEQLGIEFRKQGDQFLTKRQQMERELTKAQTEGQQLVNAGIITEQELRTRLSGIRQKYIDNTGQSEVAGIKAQIQAQSEYLDKLKKQLSTGDFSEPPQLTEAEKKVIQLEKEKATALNDVARAQKNAALEEAKKLVPIEKAIVAQQIQNKLYQEAMAVLTKQADATSQEADAIQQQALSQEAANATFGKSKTAIEQLVLAQMKLNLAQREAFDPAGSEKEVEAANRSTAALRSKTEAQERYVAALQKSEAQQIAQQLTEGTRVSQEETATLQLQLSLIGQTQEVRDRILAQRKSELDLAKEIAKIDQSGASEADKEKDRAMARAKALIDSSNAAAKTTLDEWQRTADSINQSLTDALLRGFESGKGFAQNFRDTVKNMFGTLVLKPVIQAVMSPVSGALTSIGQGIAGNLIGGSGAAGAGSSLLGTAGSLGSLAGLGSIASAFTAGSSSVGVMAGSIAGGGGLLGGAASALGAIGPVGWVALAGLAAYSLFGNKSHGPKTENGAGIGVRTAGDVASVAATIKQIQAQYGGIVSGLGGTPGQLDLGIFSAQDPNGTALTQLQVNAALNGQSVYSRDARLGHDNIENVGRSPEELQAAMTEETERVVLSALQASHLTGAIGDYLKQLGDINTLSGGAVEESLTRAQNIATQQAQLQAQIFDLTHTDLEKLTATRAKERAAIDQTNQALYDQVARLQDLTTAAQNAQAAQDTARGSLADAYQRESAALQSTVQQHENYADSLRKVRDGLAASGAGLTRSQITARAGQTFQSTLAGALRGDTASLDALGGAGTALVDALKQSAHSPQEVAAGIARVQAGLTTAAASEDARATVAQQQLDAMTQQLTALGVINDTVTSVGDALVGYLDAVSRNTAAQAALQAAQLAANGGTAATAAAAAANPVDAVRNAVDALKPFIPAMANLPGFATGGAPSGSAVVGERGREVVDFETPARVYTNEQTEGMFASNAALQPLLQRVVDLLETARSEERSEAMAMIAPLAKLDSRLKKFDTVGMPPVREDVAP